MAMSSWFTNRVALVTGAGNGIGRASAQLFARHGAKVAVVDMQVDGGEETVELIRQAGGEAIFIRTDVSDKDAVQAMVARTVEAFGGLHAAHNNAGLCNPNDVAWDDGIVERTLRVNLDGVYQCMKHEIAHMLAYGGGAIVNTASILGLVASEQIGYTASKHAVIGLTKSAALKYAARGIRINAVCPGVILTKMTRDVLDADEAIQPMLEASIPMKRMGRPEELAECAVWLCSDKPSYVTGQTLVSDGGFTLR